MLSSRARLQAIRAKGATLLAGDFNCRLWLLVMLPLFRWCMANNMKLIT
jgi:hypothetical protein